MDQTTIFAPVFAMFFLTMIVWVYMYAKRIPYIQTNNFTRDEMEPIEFARNSPPECREPFRQSQEPLRGSITVLCAGGLSIEQVHGHERGEYEARDRLNLLQHVVLFKVNSLYRRLGMSKCDI